MNKWNETILTKGNILVIEIDLWFVYNIQKEC